MYFYRKLVAMEITESHLIYFSATGTTEKIVRAIGSGVGMERVTEHALLAPVDRIKTINSNEIAIFGIPVYSGRVPAVAAERLRMFRGESTPAVIAVVYGNREFDDALIELLNIVESCGFSVIAAGAFVAEHSIFPAVGHDRPNPSDREAAAVFGKKSMELLTTCPDTVSAPSIEVRGNTPYRAVAAIPLRPKASKQCNGCGICAKQCPVGAIDPASPRKTDKTLCISCAHCISVCPQKARHFGGLLYKLVSKKFISKCSEPKMPYVIYK